MNLVLVHKRLLVAACLTLAGAGLTALPAAADQVQLTATMNGANEVPGPGDPHGTGTAIITVDTDHSTVCYQLSVSGLSSTPTAAHIHHGAAGEAGPVLVPLTPPTNGTSSGCVSVDPGLASGIANYPDGYYANVHTTDFPDGAIRGQLMVVGADNGDQAADHDLTPPGHHEIDENHHGTDQSHQATDESD